MKVGELVTGMQHIGIPTNDIAATIDFYESLGFRQTFRTMNGANEVCFLQLQNVVIETYQNGQAVMKAGAVDHIAIDVSDIEKAYEVICQGDYKHTTDGIQFLPFFENGVKFFKIEGPNGESVEFGEIL